MKKKSFDYFKLIRRRLKMGEVYFYFTELNNITEANIQDFSIQGKNVFCL